MACPDRLPDPVSDFTDAADGLEQSCADLVGQPINKITTAPNGDATPATPITAADCTAGRQDDDRRGDAHRPGPVQLPAAARTGLAVAVW